MHPDVASWIEQIRERAALGHEIGQRVTVEDVEKGFERLPQNTAQGTCRLDSAGVWRAKAVDQTQVGLGVSHDFPDDDLCWPSRQPHATSVTAHRLDITGDAELVYDLHQVVLRDPVGVGDFGDGNQLVGSQRKADQHSQRVVGVSGKAHAGSAVRTNPYSQRSIADLP